jgi:hypothetical protein
MAVLIMHLGVALGEAVQNAAPDGADTTTAAKRLRRSKPKAAIRLAVTGEIDDFNGPKAS